MLFEFDRFFKDQNVVKSRIHFNDEGGLYWGGWGWWFYNQMHFLFTGRGAYKWKGGGGVVIGSLRYERLSLNVSCISAVFMRSKLHLIVV